MKIREKQKKEYKKKKKKKKKKRKREAPNKRANASVGSRGQGSLAGVWGQRHQRGVGQRPTSEAKPSERNEPKRESGSGECRRGSRFPRPKTQRCQANADGTPDSRAPKHNGVRRMQTGLPHSPEEKSLAIYALRYPFSSEFSSAAP